MDKQNDYEKSSSSSLNAYPSLLDGFIGFETLDGENQENTFMGSNQQIDVVNDLQVESSLLNLKLTKTPSFINLIEGKLNQGKLNQKRKGYLAETFQTTTNGKKNKSISNDSDGRVSRPSNVERFTATNFPARLLKIGSWEKDSKCEGDLIVKFYFASEKIVYELSEFGLKSKIEIIWSRIASLRATFLDNELEILEFELFRSPRFFSEMDPQPKKRTLWYDRPDFTGGQALICRRHFLQFPKGTLKKPYKKLLQYNERLLLLSKKPFPSMNNPFFESNFCGCQDIASKVTTPEIYPGLKRVFTEGSYQRQIPLFSIPTTIEFPFRQVPGFQCREQTTSAIAIGNSYGNQIQELPLISRSNQTMFFPWQIDSNSLPSFDGSSCFFPNNHIPKEIPNPLLNDSLSSMCSDKNIIVAEVNSMGNPDMTSKPNFLVNTTANREDYNLEKTIDEERGFPNTAKSVDSEHIDEELGFPNTAKSVNSKHIDKEGRFSIEEYKESLLMCLPRVESFPYLDC